MSWHPGVPAPSALWPVGEIVTVTAYDGRLFEGPILEHFSPYSVIVGKGPRPDKVMVPCGRIEGCAERFYGYLADVAMGLRAPIDLTWEQFPASK